MMDIAKLKELVGLMKANDLTELELKGDKETVILKRGGTVGPVVHVASPPPAAVAPVMAASAHSVPPPTAAPTAGSFIESPMVGTFYSSPNPDAAPFVKPGQAVTPDTVVCIIEAMKVFNEIKAEKSGTIESMLVKSGQAVEFGHKLFSLR